MNGEERTACDYSLPGMPSFSSVARSAHLLETFLAAGTSGGFSLLISSQKTIATPPYDQKEQRQKQQDERVGQNERVHLDFSLVVGFVRFYRSLLWPAKVGGASERVLSIACAVW